MTTRRSTVRAAAASLLVTVLAGCGLNSDPLQSGGSGGGGEACDVKPKEGPIKIGSANFPESGLLAEIYAGALRAKGVKVSTTDPIGAREAYLKALGDGSVQIVPEYTGSLLTYLDPENEQNEADATYAALRTTVPCDQIALNPSKAEDRDGVAVTPATAKKWNLKTISDLAKHSDEVTFGGPPEFQGRQKGLKGLKSVYNLQPKNFRPLGAANAIAAALKNDQVQAANLFTTDPTVKQEGFVLLEDDKRLFGAEQVVPLVARSAATPKVQTTLDAVSAALTTDELAEMVKQVVIDKKPATQVAAAFLKKHDLD